MNTALAIAPRDEREATLIAEHARDLREKWDVRVGPLLRRRSDGKLIRLPDIESPHTYDAPSACGEFLLGRGPGRQHGVIWEWIDFARTFDSLDPERQARLALMALRNRQALLDNLVTNPPAPEDEHKFKDVYRPIPRWARIHQFTQPAPLHRCEVEGAVLTPAGA